MNNCDPQHIFCEHLLQVQHSAPVPVQQYTLVWPSVLLLVCFMLLVLVKITSLPKVLRVVQACFSLQSLRQMEREEAGTLKSHSSILLLFFLLNFSFFLYKINLHYRFVFNDHSTLSQYLLITLLTLLAFLGKNVVVYLLAQVMDGGRVLPEFNFNALVITQTLGLLLFPFMVLAELGKFDPLLFLSVGAVIVAVMQLYKWYRGMLFSLIEQRVGLLQIFTYFCSLEILPALVSVKFVIEKF